MFCRVLELQAAPRVLDLRLQRLLPLHLLHGVLLPHHLVQHLAEPLLLLLCMAAVAAPLLLLLIPPLPLLLQLLRRSASLLEVVLLATWGVTPGPRGPAATESRRAVYKTPYLPKVTKRTRGHQKGTPRSHARRAD